MKIENHFAQGAIVNNGQMNVGGGTIHVHVQGKQQVVEEQAENATCNPQPDKKSIIDYVMKLHPMYVRQGWREKYQALWNDVLELPAVAEKVYNKGKQQHEYEFNRDLVGKILRLLKTEGVMTHQANATKMSEELEGNKNSSVRTHLGLMPSDDVKTAVKALISQKGKEC